MTAKLCKEQQKSFGSNVKYSDFVEGKIIFIEKLVLKRTLLLRLVKIFANIFY